MKNDEACFANKCIRKKCLHRHCGNILAKQMKSKERKRTESRKECIPSSSIDCIKASLNPKSMSNLQSTKKKVDLALLFHDAKWIAGKVPAVGRSEFKEIYFYKVRWNDFYVKL